MAKQKSKKERGVFRFLSPEEADALIKTHRKGRNWTEEEKMARDSIIWEYMCRQGLSRYATAQQISDRWNVALSVAYMYIKEAFQTLVDDYEENKIDTYTSLIERVEGILQTALENGNLSAALQATEQIAKLQGLYKDKKEVEITDKTQVFKFGE